MSITVQDGVILIHIPKQKVVQPRPRQIAIRDPLACSAYNSGSTPAPRAPS